MAKNFKMANKGKVFEEEVILTNKQYKRKGIALIQKISTPWTVIRKGKQIVSAFPEGKSTLDFRGTVRHGISISFDCKETKDERGLPLRNIADHQIDYMRQALKVGELTFILCYIKPLNKRYMAIGEDVIGYWDRWQRNKGKRGFNLIPIEDMKEVRSSEVRILTPIGLDRNRQEILRAVAILPDNIIYDRFIDTEEFNIMIQSGFTDNEHKELLLKFTGLIRDEAVKDTGDDGISQAVTIKTGVASVADAKVPNPVLLAPYRTFPEIKQVESKFIFRMKEGPRAALFEADGGVWKNEAMRRIKDYLVKNLKGMGDRFEIIS